MRSFRDTGNIEWTVFEVRRQVRRADAAPSPGYSDAWLCFESSAAKRRLLKYPERWREMTDVELAKLLSEATPAPRANLSISDGLEGGCAARGA